MMNIKEIKTLLKRHNIAALKSRGQHFLMSEQALRQIIHVANITQYDTILEIGPGLGVLTDDLVRRAKKVIAVELDKGFAEILKNEFRDIPHLKIAHENILNIKLADHSLLTTDYKLIGNLPYTITSLILDTFLRKAGRKPKTMIVMVQKEFALRLMARPPSMNRIALLSQYYGIPKIVAHFPPSCFWPEPRVHSSLVYIDVRSPKTLPLKAREEERLWASIKTAFSQPRKILKNSLSLNSETFSQKRPQELTLENWIRLLHSM